MTTATVAGAVALPESADIPAEARRVQAARDLYDVLGVAKTASEIDIRRNYRRVREP